MKFSKIANSLSEDDIIKLMEELGASNYIKRDTYIIFPTICHNTSEDKASMKLWYYLSNNLFHCYTECGETFDIFELVQRVFNARGRHKVGTAAEKKEPDDYTFFDVVNFVTRSTNYIGSYDTLIYEPQRQNYEIKKHFIENPIINENILEAFESYLPVEWKEEGISTDTMKKYEICYYSPMTQIVIPHRNINGQLIGIRGRALDPAIIESYGKYRPIDINGTIYSHPLSQNLYGLYKTQKAIKSYKTAIIFEGEKSVLKSEDFFKEKNIGVAACGSKISKNQVLLLIKNCNINEICIGFDKEFHNNNDKEMTDYFNKLSAMCKKYLPYCNFSFIFDFENLLDYKDSPIDKGKEVFEKLYKGRINVNEI